MHLLPKPYKQMEVGMKHLQQLKPQVAGVKIKPQLKNPKKPFSKKRIISMAFTRVSFRFA